jgi:hypothetical protein
MRRWLIVLLVIALLIVVMAAIFITIGVLATPHGGSEGLLGHRLARPGR